MEVWGSFILNSKALKRQYLSIQIDGNPNKVFSEGFLVLATEIGGFL